MAIVFAEDWEWATGASASEMGKNGWSLGSSGVSYVASGGVNNSKYVTTQEGGTWFMERPIPNLVNTMGVVFSCLVTGALVSTPGTSGNVVSFRRAGNAHIGLTIDQDARLVALRGTTPIGVSAQPIPIGTWFDIECKIIVNDTTGYFGVKVDGVFVIQFNGDTLNSTDGWVGTVRFSNPGVPVGNLRVGYDNIVIWDDSGTVHTDWLGRIGIVYLPVNGDATPIQWTPSTGTTHYTLVDEVGTPVTTDYISAGAVDLKDIMDLANPPGNISKIEAVIPVIYGSKQGSGPSDIQLGFELTGTEHYNNILSVPGSNGLVATVFDVNPKTGAAWTYADVSSARLCVVSK